MATAFENLLRGDQPPVPVPNNSPTRPLVHSAPLHAAPLSEQSSKLKLVHVRV